MLEKVREDKVILTDEFFRSAGMRQIRKMFKLYQETAPKPEEVAGLREFLEERCMKARTKKETYAVIWLMRREDIKEAEKTFVQLHNLRESGRTCDANRLKKARNEIMTKRRLTKEAASEIKKAEKLESRYANIREELMKRFWEVLEENSDVREATGGDRGTEAHS